ncbi:MAG TPA: hypothetical protein VGL42_06240 [Opitutaceae bacterium]|jgi:hypothetical protein
MNDRVTSLETADTLADVELQIARRADELSGIQSESGKHPFEYWRQAEEEVWLRRWHDQAASGT